MLQIWHFSVTHYKQWTDMVDEILETDEKVAVIGQNSKVALNVQQLLLLL